MQQPYAANGQSQEDDEEGKYNVEALVELQRKGKKHPTKDAYQYEVKVQWSGYEGTDQEFTWEPLKNMLEDD